MTTLIILQALTLAGLIALGAVRGGLFRYAEEKGRNLATKEDIGEITERIERVRSQHSSEVERLRSDLTLALNAHKVRYETELRTYEDIWKELVAVQRAALSLRPIVDQGPQGEAERKTESRRRLESFGEAFNRFVSCVHGHRPFYPHEVFVELEHLTKLAHGEAIDFAYGDQHDRDYWRAAKDNTEKISKQVDQLCEVIRRRLSDPSLA